MNEQEAYKIVKQVEKVCDDNYPNVWHKIFYDNKPDLKFVNIEISIIISPEHTRKMATKK